MNGLTDTEKKKLASALYDWRLSYLRMESDPDVIKARKSLERAKKRLEKAEWTHKAYIQNAEHIIEEIVPNLEKSITAFGIRAKYTSGYLRISYDSKVLDRIAEQNTRLRNLIMPHRKESQVKPRVNIEVADPDTLLQDIKFTMKGLEI